MKNLLDLAPVYVSDPILDHSFPHPHVPTTLSFFKFFGYSKIILTLGLFSQLFQLPHGLSLNVTSMAPSCGFTETFPDHQAWSSPLLILFHLIRF